MIISTNFRIGQFDFYTPRMFLNKSKYLGKERMGLGFAFINDKNGPLISNSFISSYAYHLPFDVFTLSFGLDFSYNEIKIDYNALKPIDANDPYLYADKSNSVFPQSGAGIQITNELFFISLSAKNLLPNNFLEKDGFERSKPDLFVYGGYTQRVNRLFTIEPSVMAMECDGIPFTWHANAKLYYKTYNWISFSYQSTGKVSANIIFQVSTLFDFGYGYELYLHNVSQGTFSGHNFYLGRNFGLRNVHGIRKNVKQSFL